MDPPKKLEEVENETAKVKPVLTDSSPKKAICGIAQERADSPWLKTQSNDARIRKLFDALPLAVRHADAKERITYANTAYRMMSTGGEDVEGRLVLEVVGPGVYKFIAESIRNTLQGEETSFERAVIRYDGSPGFRAVHYLPDFAKSGEVVGFYALISDITEQRQAEKRAETERRLRQTLVREVHHRIKNNLQGIVGLLNLEYQSHPELGPVLQRAASQVQAIALIYGLYGGRDEGPLRVCNIVPAIARSVEALTKAAVVLDVKVSPAGIRMAEGDSVAVALIINELLWNAVKHATNKAPVRVEIGQVGNCGSIRIRNRGTLTPDFEFGAIRGIGTGLELVRALTPSKGLKLSIEQDGEDVLATVLLSAPATEEGRAVRMRTDLD